MAKRHWGKHTASPRGPAGTDSNRQKFTAKQGKALPVKSNCQHFCSLEAERLLIACSSKLVWRTAICTGHHQAPVWRQHIAWRGPTASIVAGHDTMAPNLYRLQQDHVEQRRYRELNCV